MKILKSLISISIVAMILTSGISAFAQATQEASLDTLFEIRGTYVDGLATCPPLDANGNNKADRDEEDGPITEGFDFTYEDGTTKKISKFEFQGTDPLYARFPLKSINNQNPNKKYIFHADFYLKNDKKAKGTDFSALRLNLPSDMKTVITDATGNVSNSEYRYYSYFPGSDNSGTQANYFVKGFFDGHLATNNNYYRAGNDDSGWNYPNQVSLKFNEWTSFDAAFTKPSETPISFWPYITKKYYNEQFVVSETVNEETVSYPSELYADNIYFQELALENIDIKVNGEVIDGNTITVTPDDALSFTAGVYNQFGSEIGFKDQVGTVMEPLKFVIKDKDGNVVSDNNYFTLDDSAVPTSDKIYVTTAKNSVAYNVGTGSWVTPTYDFTLRTSGLTMGETYTVTAELLNQDIYGSTEKKAEFNIKVGSRNLIPNGDFSNGKTGWKSYPAFNNSLITISYDETLGVNVGTVKQSLQGFLNDSYEKIPVYAGKTYFAYSKVKTDSEFVGEKPAGMNFMNMSFGGVSVDIKYPTVGAWYDVVGVYTPSADGVAFAQFTRFAGDTGSDYGNISATNVYLGEMLINSEITSDATQINVPYTGTSTLQLSANVTAPNGVSVKDFTVKSGTTSSVSNVWSVEEAQGVSIDASTGVLTVDNTATADSVKVNVVSTYTYDSFTFTAEDDYTVDLVAYVPGTNIISNGDFSNGKTNWDVYPRGSSWEVLYDETLGVNYGATEASSLQYLNGGNKVQVYKDKTYFIYSKVKTDDAFVGEVAGYNYMNMSFSPNGVVDVNIKNPTVGYWYDVAGVFTATADDLKYAQFTRYVKDKSDGYGNVCATNLYVSEMLINSEITSNATQINVPYTGTNTLELEANVTAPNGVSVEAFTLKSGTNASVSNEWSVEETQGVSIDASTGVLTVDNTATADSVKVKVDSTYTYDSLTFTAEDEYTITINSAIDYTLSSENVLNANIRSDLEGNTVLLAVYNGDKLLNIEEVEMTFEKDIKASYPLATEVIIFVWDTISGMTPKCNCEKITLN